jgi:hypothetical protein
MKKRKFLVKRIAQNVQVKNQDLRKEFSMNPLAEREMKSLEKHVSPQLYGMLIQQLLGFHADMQYEMAVNLVVFALNHVAHSTGCPGVDNTLDVCYAWIAMEHGILKPGIKNELFNHKNK